MSFSALASFSNKASMKGSTTQIGAKGILTTKGNELHHKRDDFKIIVHGVDYTPKPLVDPMFPITHEVDVIGDAFTSSIGPSPSALFSTYGSAIEAKLTEALSLSPSFGMDDLSDIASVEKAQYALSDAAPPQFLLPKLPYVETILPKQIRITLKETPTVFLLERPSITALEGTEEAAEILRYNKRYEEQGKSGGRTKKIAESETQTPQQVLCSRITIATRCKRENVGVNVTQFDILKTYNELRKVCVPPYEKTVIFQDPLKVDKEKQRDKPEEEDEISTNIYKKYEKEFREIARGRRFKKAVFLIERILASNKFENEQKIFKGIVHPDPFRLDIRFDYRPDLLWTFRNHAVKSRSVTAMCWNPKNGNLLAVAYGKLSHGDKRGGVVCCWCVKNPVQPERTYYFDAPVQCLDFSRLSPNLLALGFYNGDVMIIDVSSEEKSIVARNNMKFSENCAAVWTVTWFRGEDYQGRYNQVLTAGQDGRIYRYRRAKDFTCFPMMRVSRMEGKVKGIEMPRKCFSNDIPVTCNPAALVLTKHPTDKIIYFVGTDEGCIHKCSINYLHQHLDLFLAHRGAVYTLQFSPFWDKILMTSGADWCVRIWAEGIDEPLIELKDSTEPVQGACWSPANSTILASVSGRSIHVWDIRRKTFAPVTAINSPSNSVNTCVNFTASGDGLVVGDVDGHVHVFALEDKPFSPFFQKDALFDAIVKALVLRPDLVKQLTKIGVEMSKRGVFS